MMDDRRSQGGRDPWFRWSVLSVVAIAAVAIGIGFVGLPSFQGDYAAQGLWASICRAAGVPQAWGQPSDTVDSGRRSTAVVLDASMTRVATADAAGHGATLALQRCAMCHGAHGAAGGAGAPNLDGQYAEVFVKQLADYRRGDRHSALMQAMAGNLTEQQTLDLAAYYGSLRRPDDASADTMPVLVNLGDPMRNIAPCASCHGAIDHKLGAPWLSGAPKAYVAAQLAAFASGDRRNDSHAQMRNMARQLTRDEIESLATYYGGP